MKTWRRSEYSEPIPTDMIYEILLSLPAKSIARFRSVSKLWRSILGRPDFTELFLTKSSCRPQLLLTCVKDNELFFFSTPQTNCGNWFPVVAVEYHMKLRCDGFIQIFNPISGLVCFKDKRGRKNVTVICNPSTGQSFTLPKMKTRRRVALSRYLGYDPIKKQFKVLAMTFPSRSDYGISEEHQVLTLGGTGSWRMVQCCIPHCPGWKVICISGVLYYQAKVNMSSSCSMIVCFDVRSEKFSFIKVTEAFTSVVHDTSTLINYKGKLGSITTPDYYCVSGKTGAFVLCVLEDPEKHEWSKHIYFFSPWWEHVFEQRPLHIAGVTRTDEVVFTKKYPNLNDPFYVFYYNLEKKTIRRERIQGMGGGNNVYTFIDHVEDLNLKHLI